MGTTEDFFEGPPSGLPVPMPRGVALYRQEAGPPAVVRHVGGYAPFVDFCAGRGERAEELAADPGRLIRFLRASGADMEKDSSLRAAAAIFAGNAIARLRPDARWTAYEGASPTAGNREKQFEIDRLFEGLRSADDEAVRRLISVLSDWSREEPDPSPAMRPVPVLPPAGAARYVRPPCRRRGTIPPRGSHFATASDGALTVPTLTPTASTATQSVSPGFTTSP